MKSKYRRVYHFLEAKWALDDIEKRRIKISRFTDLNDPYELQGAQLDDRNMNDHLLRDWPKRVGLLCFCNSWTNPVMWAHYANRHRGIALGFDTAREQLKDVRYVSKRELIEVPQSLRAQWNAVGHGTQKVSKKLQRESEPLFGKMLTTKHSGWSYEEESRVFASLNTGENGSYFLYFKGSGGVYLREVILGTRCEVSEQLIVDLTADYPGHVDVLRAATSSTSFFLVGCI